MWGHQVTERNGLEMPAEFVRRRRRQRWDDLLTALVLGVALIAVVCWRACR
jgi:hypothetical protein